MVSPLEQGQGEHWWLRGDVFGDAEGLASLYLCGSLARLLLALPFPLGIEPGAGQGSGSPDGLRAAAWVPTTLSALPVARGSGLVAPKQQQQQGEGGDGGGRWERGEC